MIGNDIIDLALAKKESNWQRKGFIEKIFTSSEQLLIFNADEPEIMVWYLWSQKEAAYKIYNRQTQIRAYIPLQLECFDLKIIDSIHYGKVRCYDQIYFTKTQITLDYISTDAVINPTDFERIEFLDATTSIKKSNGIPNYYSFQNNNLIPVSKSHHGRFERIVALYD
ncbi:4'-phosphopantetheinyl transferase superfamily protein [Flavobacterium sp. N1994]|uniref:4'-phosphopantetheinyl transferase family protein n=1 Tax=Flavobacterium sp. N1994 TaxID=2986827 RepID=UPI002223E746|nr:4'-phosphopantetheinyl transferase superfamily protein [Flavobacterium sp. N1994]